MYIYNLNMIMKSVLSYGSKIDFFQKQSFKISYKPDILQLITKFNDTVTLKTKAYYQR